MWLGVARRARQVSCTQIRKQSAAKGEGALGSPGVSHRAWELNINTSKLGALLKVECWEAVVSKHAAGCLCWWMCWNKLSQLSLVRDVKVGIEILSLAFDHRSNVYRSKHSSE